MLWSRLFIPTLRETPSGAGALLLRAGYARQIAPGIYGYLPLGRRSLDKIASIARQETAKLGAQEMLWPSHPKAIAALARGGLRSHKQLPQIWRRIEALGCDSFSFDLDASSLDDTYAQQYDAAARILGRCGIPSRTLTARSAAHFVVESPAGDDSILTCRACDYAALRDEAVSRPTPLAVSDPPGDLAPEEFHTPGCKTIATLSEFTRLPEASQMKSLVWMAGGQLILILLRGDHQLSESKLAAVTDEAPLRPARPEEIRAVFGADAGSLGPVGVRGVSILADDALQSRRNMICGANKNEYHLRHVTPGEDFHAEFHDLRLVEAGEACCLCGAALEIRTVLHIAHLTRLGARFAESLGLHLTNASAKEIAPAMGRYHISFERILLAAAEQHHDKDGLRLPASIAPFTAVITPVNTADAAQRTAAHEIYRQCLDLGLDALLDDREERPGVKLKDADLIGVPFRITLGKKIAGGIVELVERGGKITDVAVTGAAARLAEIVRQNSNGS